MAKRTTLRKSVVRPRITSPTRELADYVEVKVITLSQEVFKKQQTPVVELGGNMFPVAKVR